jgi:hypothetical protein
MPAGRSLLRAASRRRPSDAEQLVPMLGRIVATTSRRPAPLMADAGFFSEANRVAAEQAGVDVYIPLDRDAHGHALAAGRRHPARAGHASARMRDKLRTADGEALYRRRKAIIEPVFVYIKAIRGFRRFSMRGLDKVRASRLRCPDDSAVVEKTPLSIRVRRRRPLESAPIVERRGVARAFRSHSLDRLASRDRAE